MGKPHLIGALCVGLGLVACGSSPPSTPWQVVGRHLPAALVSVWGDSNTNVFAVGGDINDGSGPIVEHFDGTTWTRLPTGQAGNLWWVFGFAGGPVYMGGDGGMILRYDGSAFTRMSTPGINTIFGIWGASPDDVWAVGGAIGGANGAFAWRLDHGNWVAAAGFPTDLAATDAIWKMYGRSANDAWMVGTNGVAIRWDGALTKVSTGSGESLFTVHADAERFVAVGGFGTGSLLENTGAGWTNASPPGVPGLIGVCVTPDISYAVGQEGAIVHRDKGQWRVESTPVSFDEAFHTVWIDTAGGVWVVGGQVQSLPLNDGVMLYKGDLALTGALN